MLEVATDIDALREIALDQHGFVTRVQAIDAGVSASSIDQLVHRNRIERVGHGIYRIPQVPATPEDNLQLALLWTGREDAVLSHETALDAYDVCDLISDEIHICLPRNSRVRRSGGDQCVIHRENLKPSEIQWWEGMRIVTPAHAIKQCIGFGTPTYLIRQAMERSRARGYITKDAEDDLQIQLDVRQCIES